jgi:hypothetical protein
LLRKSNKGKSWTDLMMMERVVTDKKKLKDIARQAKTHSGL